MLVAKATLAIALLFALAPSAAAGEAQDAPHWAWFDGRKIDLRDGWQGAQACATDGHTTTCFHSEDEMLAAEASSADAESELLASCSTSLRLYDGTNFGSPVLQLSTRALWLNLSTYGFDNVTSSYRVGACSSLFAAGANGSGGTYPGNTSAGAQAASMLAGWNNVVSSVYIS